MAGTYADVPSRRWAYDQDGTVGTHWKGQGDTFVFLDYYEEWIQSDFDEINDESNSVINFSSSSGSTPTYFCYALIFPEPRNLLGYFISTPADSRNTWDLRAVEVSTDTTNGFSGSWTALTANDVLYTYPNYRTDIVSTSQTAIRAIRWRRSGRESGHRQSGVHLYGTLAAGVTPHRLLFIDTATGLEFTGPIDWGDVPRGTVHDRTLRIKNNSTTQTASTVTLSFEDLYLGSSSWYTIKETGGGFASTLAISEILPSATYPAGTDVITVRKTVADDEELLIHAARLKAATQSWGVYANIQGSATVTASLSVT